MGFYNVINPSLMTQGQPEDISQVLANFNAIASVLNGNIDDTNLNAAANIAVTKLFAGPAGRLLGVNQGPTIAWLPSMQEIMDYTVPGGGLASVDTTTVLGVSLPQTFKHLLFMATLRSIGAESDVGVRVNNDAAAANYESTYLNVTTTAGGVEELGTQQSIYCGTMPASTAPANRVSSVFGIIPNYTQAPLAKNMLAITYEPRGTTTGQLVIRLPFGVYDGSAGSAITRIAWVTRLANLAAGSRVSLYGVG